MGVFMDSNEFESALKSLSLSKKEFAEKVGMSYNSVVNWNKKGIPSWVESWLRNYAKSSAFDMIADSVDRVRSI